MNIIIVDSKESYLDSLTEFFSNSDKYSVTKRFHSLEEYTSNFIDEKSIILFELSERNIEVLSELNQNNWQKYIGLSIYNDSNLAGKAIVAGASSVISKSEDLKGFEGTLDIIKSGSGVVPKSLLSFLQKRENRNKVNDNKFYKIVSKLFL